VRGVVREGKAGPRHERAHMAACGGCAGMGQEQAGLTEGEASSQ